MKRVTTVKSLTELGQAMRDHTARFWDVAPTDKDGDESKDHGNDNKPEEAPKAPNEPPPDDHVIERTLPSRKPIGPTDI